MFQQVTSCRHRQLSNGTQLRLRNPSIICSNRSDVGNVWKGRIEDNCLVFTCARKPIKMQICLSINSMHTLSTCLLILLFSVVLTNLNCQVDKHCVHVQNSICHPGAGFCACPGGTVYVPYAHACREFRVTIF